MPRELGLDEALGGQALESLDDLQVGNVKLLVLGGIVIFFGDKYALCNNNPRFSTSPIPQISLQRTLEEVLVDDAPVLFGNDHAGPMDLLRRKLWMK